MSKKHEYLKDTIGGKVVKTDDFMSSFLEARQWLETQRINVNNSRFMHCYKLLANREKPSWDKLWAYTELHDLVEIFENLGNLKSAKLLESLKTVAKGPILLREEGSSGGSIHGRNFTFELYTASRLARAEFATTFDTDSDVNFICNNNLMHVECKRVSSPDSLENLVNRAHKQIRKRCDSYGGRGIVALSISKLVHLALTQDEFGQPKEDLYANYAELQDLMRENVAKWCQLLKLHFSSSEKMSIGILLHYKMPFIDRKTNAWTFLNRFSLVNYNNSALNTSLAEEISLAMSNSVF